jgi:uncharacterized protein YyaL (SSP411 family)
MTEPSTPKNPHTNRLINEKSPYLLQHAHNPVDWYPWGEEAFNASKASDKPIFLSIGYATCHWCHVMERESFENAEIATLLNESFINIKVDREELPEIDSLYMEFAQSMMAGSAGWPLNLILTPNLEPFFAATYLPPRSRQGLMGLQELIARIHDIWKGDEREKVSQQAAKIVEAFSEAGHNRGDNLPSSQLVSDAAELLFKLADPIYGGIKGTPKFPIGYQLSFLLRFAARTNDSRALFLAEKTLEMMHRGGIYDHLGGGFSRYSVDEKWLVPHFEKMLYDNAILSQAYTEAWQFAKKPLYREVSQDILDYILREMTSPDGGFYSAEDSETDGHEGLFYTWLLDEVKDLLGDSVESSQFCEFFDITQEGNFEGTNILNTPLSVEEFASKKNIKMDELKDRLEEQKKILFKVRNERKHPLKDDKIITSWNGMMIHSMAYAGSAFGEEKYLNAAVRAAKFIQSNLYKDGHLFRRWREGEALHLGVLDDYVYMIRASITLFESGLGSQWLKWAIELTNFVEENFKSEEGAFFSTDGHEENLIIRKCQFSDGAEPSGNAIHCENLLRLYQITLDSKYLSQAEDILKAVKRFLDNYPLGYMYHVINLHFYLDKRASSDVVSLNTQKDYKNEIAHLLFGSFIPHRVIVWREENDTVLFSLAPFLQRQPSIDGQTTVYICHHGVCLKPLVLWKEIEEALKT